VFGIRAETTIAEQMRQLVDEADAAWMRMQGLAAASQ
jgi:hypothetical protein